ncbi:MAG: hypothetical protein ACOYK6_00505 [Chthoniobacterales bacterium]
MIIPNDAINSQTFAYAGGHENAVKHLNELAENLISPSGKLKTGTLRLVKEGDSFALKRSHRWLSWTWGFRGALDKSKTSQYLTALLLHAAAHQAGTTQNQLDENLKNYLSFDDSKSVTTAELAAKLISFKIREDINPQQEKVDDNQKPLKHLQSFPIGLTSNSVNIYHEPQLPSNFLQSIGISLGKQLAGMHFNLPYAATVTGSNNEYIFNKGELCPMTSIEDELRKNNNSIPLRNLGFDTNENDGKYERIFMIVALQKKKNDRIDHYYVSANELTKFLRDFANKNPKALYGIAAQLAHPIQKIESNQTSRESRNNFNIDELFHKLHPYER